MKQKYKHAKGEMCACNESFDEYMERVFPRLCKYTSEAFRLNASFGAKIEIENLLARIEREGLKTQGNK